MPLVDALEGVTDFFKVIVHDKKNYGHYMGGACSAYGREERRIQVFGGET
jgi:hypothetical protein